MGSLVVPFTLSLFPAEANTTGTQTTRKPLNSHRHILVWTHCERATHTDCISISQGEALGLNTGSEGETLDLETHTQKAAGTQPDKGDCVTRIRYCGNQLIT